VDVDQAFRDAILNDQAKLVGRCRRFRCLRSKCVGAGQPARPNISAPTGSRSIHGATVLPTQARWGHARVADEARTGTWSIVGLTCAILAVVAAVWMYWVVVPGLILGVAAVVIGVVERRKGPSEIASVTLALGLTAVLLVPSVLFIADEAESYGQDCAVDPSDC
jgi:hypothetical protein